MGGINHQPCSDYDPEAILLSNIFSRAYSKFWSGNSEVEEALSFEISGMIDQAELAITRAQFEIRGSLQLIELTDLSLDKLLRSMEKKSFQDLSSLKEIDFAVFRKNLDEISLLPDASKLWQFSVDNIKDGGYRQMFAVLKANFKLLEERTQRFLDVLRKSHELITKGNLQKSLNENKFGNLKQTFGSLFCAWSNASHLFYFSSLISVELWYIQHKFGSLTDK